MRRKKLALSGGRTSAYMLWLLIQEHGLDAFNEQFTITFCNTGKEFDQTLDFVRDIQRHWGVNVVWLEYTRVPAVEIDPLVYPHPKSQKTIREQQAKGLTTHWFKTVNWETARRSHMPNTPFDELLSWANVLPNLRTRICSVQMKVRTMMRYLFSQGVYAWDDFIGIRADEAHRAVEIAAHCPKYIGLNFPLINAKTTEEDVLRFWKQQPFDLRLEPYQGNCDLCYLKARFKRVRLASEFPEKLKWWEQQEANFAQKPNITGDGKFFRKGEPFAAIREQALSLPKLETEDQDIPCGCGDKGFVITAAQDAELEN